MMGVLHKKIQPAHEDERRSLIEAFNGQFTARQLKVLHIKKDSVLGNHYHPYGQFFYMLKGSANYTFRNINTGEQKNIFVDQGDLVIIDKEIAHKALQKAGNIMVEGNEQPYTAKEIDDLYYEIK